MKSTTFLLRMTMGAGLVAVAGGVGCSLFSDDAEMESGSDRVVTGDVANVVMKSTLQLEGCTAAKVGPRHLLLAARCVGDKAIFAEGKTLSLTVSSKDVADAGEDEKEIATKHKISIANVEIHSSYLAKCKGDACDFTKLAAADSPDVAVVVLKEDLDSVPTVPVDLDPVAVGDELLVVTGGCSFVGGKPEAQVTIRTEAAAAKTVNHEGSPYKQSPHLVSTLNASYAVTEAAGLKAKAPRLCASDIGAPVFRARAAAVVGVTSNYTTFPEQRVPATVHHTRVDATSRFKVGEWLKKLGVATIHACSENANGCVKDRDAGTFVRDASSDARTDAAALEVDGSADMDAGFEDADAGDAGDVPEEDAAPRRERLPDDTSDDDGARSSKDKDDGDDDAGATKKKADKSGCSAAPLRSSSPSGGGAFGMALVLAAIIARRRRAA